MDGKRVADGVRRSGGSEQTKKQICEVILWLTEISLVELNGARRSINILYTKWGGGMWTTFRCWPPRRIGRKVLSDICQLACRASEAIDRRYGRAAHGRCEITREKKAKRCCEGNQAVSQTMASLFGHRRRHQREILNAKLGKCVRGWCKNTK